MDGVQHQINMVWKFNVDITEEYDIARILQMF